MIKKRVQANSSQHRKPEYTTMIVKGPRAAKPADKDSVRNASLGRIGSAVNYNISGLELFSQDI